MKQEMFLKKRSPLQKAISQHEHLLKSWTKNYYNDGSIEEIIYEKDEMKIIFQEDLREHIVNLRVVHPCKRYIKVEYRQCIYCAEELDCEDLINGLQRLKDLNNKEGEEISLYFDFIKKNEIVTNL